MHNMLNIFNIEVPAYGTMVLLGTAVITILGIIICLYRKMSVADFLKLEFSGGIFAVAGSKVWYIIVNTSNHTEKLTVETFLNSGYSSYGGIFLGMTAVYLTAKLLKADYKNYVRYLIFLVPLFHAFWKTGCYMGGCCYGIEYSGVGATVFPEGVMAPAGIPLFPVQLMEVFILLGLSAFFMAKNIKGMDKPISAYMVSYAVLRFIVEFFRYRSGRSFLSAAQWVSLGCVLLFTLWRIAERKYTKYGGRNE